MGRIGRGQNLRTPPFALSVLGGIQPGKIARQFKAAVHGAAEDDGFIQRFSILISLSVKYGTVFLAGASVYIKIT